MSAAAVVIVDYGMGNTGSLRNMLSRVGVPSHVSNDPDLIGAADRLILPGVGAFDHAMAKLNATGIAEAIVDRSTRTEGLLVGVCLGMQLLLDASEEGALAGLGLVPGQARRFPSTIGSERLPVPHMGWNEVRPARTSRRVPRLGLDSRYYFVHSYFAVPSDPGDSLGETDYGVRFCSAVERGSVMGFQFHPEKSHRHGWQLLSDLFTGEWGE